MFCPNCGTRIPENETICPHCYYNDATGRVENPPNRGYESMTTSQEKEKENPVPEVSEINSKPTASKENLFSTNPKPTIVNKAAYALAIVFWIAAAGFLISNFIMTSTIMSGAEAIASISSVGGKTLEEAYYYWLGSNIYPGMAIAFSCFNGFVITTFTAAGFVFYAKRNQPF